MSTQQSTTQEGLVHVPNMQRLTELCQRFIALEEKKERGNERFKNKEWSNSAKLYTEGIALATDCPNCSKVLYTNRAAARKEMKQLLPAQEDCTAAIKLDPSYATNFSLLLFSLLFFWAGVNNQNQRQNITFTDSHAPTPGEADAT